MVINIIWGASSFIDLSNGELIYRPYNDKDRNKMVELLLNAFTVWPPLNIDTSPQEHLKWKYEDNPWGVYCGMVCEAGDKLVASTYTFVFKYKIGENIFLGGLGADSCVHTEYRRKGIYNKILNAKNDFEPTTGIKFRFHGSGNKILVERSKRLAKKGTGERIEFPHKIVQMVYIRDIDLHLEKMPTKNPIVTKYGYLTLRFINKILYEKNRAETKLVQIFQIDKFDEGFRELLIKEQESYVFTAIRNPEYLNWRYCDPRTGSYAKFAAYREGEIVGYIVCTENTTDMTYHKGYIMDIATLEDDYEATYALIQRAQDFFKAKGINIVQFLTLHGGRYLKYFKEAGFIDSRTPLYLYYHTYAEDLGVEKFQSLDPSKIKISFENYDFN